MNLAFFSNAWFWSSWLFTVTSTICASALKTANEKWIIVRQRAENKPQIFCEPQFSVITAPEMHLRACGAKYKWERQLLCLGDDACTNGTNKMRLNQYSRWKTAHQPLFKRIKLTIHSMCNAQSRASHGSVPFCSRSRSGEKRKGIKQMRKNYNVYICTKLSTVCRFGFHPSTIVCWSDLWQSHFQSFLFSCRRQQ